MTFQSYSESRVPLVEDYIRGQLTRFRQSVSMRFGALIDAMHYSLEGGGKRLRPLILLGSAECVGLNPQDVLPAACAIEYVHTYSLVHDDLPAIDDDDTRRGKPSNHRKFGEAIAILAGDALLTQAFSEMYHLADGGKFDAVRVLESIQLLATQSGVAGMVGGQLLDVTTAHTNFSLPEVEFIHIHKTGAMILAAVLLPTKLVAISADRIQRLRRYGEAVGLAFQISDDLLDAEASVRYSRGPRKKPKPSYTQLMSRGEIRDRLNVLIDTAVQALESEGERALPLISIAEFVRSRKH